MSADDVAMAPTTAAEEMGAILASFGFIGLSILSLWEVLGSPPVVLFGVAGFVLLVGLFAAVEGGR